ncbi:MAG: lamin tail domain-containing protein [Flavitalea sp.]
MRKLILMMAGILGSYQTLCGQALHDLLINEIMADPSPVIGLPNQEYVELLNRSHDTINLQNCWIIIGNDSVRIRENYWLPPDSVILLCKTSALNELKYFGACIGIPSFPSINNESDLIAILSHDLRTIHAIPYDVSFQSNRVKSQGGWSIELTDPALPCMIGNNYKSSTDPSGGTPGRKNSNPQNLKDNDPPRMISSYMKDSMILLIHFTEPVDSTFASDIDAFKLSDQLKVLKAEVLPPLFDKVKIFLGSKPPDHVFTVSAELIKDCAGNLSEPNITVKAAIVNKPDSGDLVINEVLFNPSTGGSDYVEIFNRSQKSFDLNKLIIAGRNNVGDLDDGINISAEPLMIYPGEFRAVSTDIKFLEMDYGTASGHLNKVSQLPSMPDDKGIVVLTDEQGKVLDELHYDKSWHHPFLKNEDGISLERLDPGSATNTPSNWTSCATEIKGTPGKVNSQSLANNGIKGGIKIDKKIFSPDNDGFEDFLLLNYSFDQSGVMGSIRIYNVNGQQIRVLLNNELLPVSGWIKWDGSNENKQPCLTGLYILDAVFHTATGKKIKFREAITLAKRF